MRVRSFSPTLSMLGFLGLAVACGGQAQDERVGDQFDANAGAGPGSGATSGKGGAGNVGNTGGTGNVGNTGGVGNTGNTGGTGNVGNTGGTGNVGNSGGASSSTCGNFFCEAGESCASCPNDCGPCGKGGQGGTGPAACAHDVCSSGPALQGTCGKCELIVCQSDAFCCDREWDAVCVNEAQNSCGLDCGVGGSPGTGGFGAGPGKGGSSSGKGGSPTGGGGFGAGPAGICGDAVCDPSESCSACPQDCGPCGNACSHDVCIAGPPLKNGACGPCAGKVCAQDPFCCESYWDSTCVSAASQCAPCGGGTGGAGGAPAQDCKSCALSNCGKQVSACFSDKVCASCAQGSSDPTCFGNPRLQDLLVCTCNGACSQSCVEECQVVGGGGSGGSAGAGGGPSTSVCGDLACNAGETCASCPSDCGSCGCSHGECSAGGRLDGACSACTQTVCSQDPFCCSTDWDDQCVGRAKSSCGPEACLDDLPPPVDSHDACPGGPLTTLTQGATLVLQGDTRIDKNDHEPSCVQGGVPGNDAVYAVKVEQKGTFVAQVTSGGDLDPILSFKKACQGGGPLCVNNGVGKGTSEAMKREVQGGEVFFVVIDAASGTSGPYKLELSLQ